MVDAPVGIQKVGAVGSDAAPDWAPDWANAASAEAFEAAWLMIWEVIDMVFVSS
jgi:RES domain-containing protein